MHHLLCPMPSSSYAVSFVPMPHASYAFFFLTHATIPPPISPPIESLLFFFQSQPLARPCVAPLVFFTIFFFRQFFSFFRCGLDQGWSLSTSRGGPSASAVQTRSDRMISTTTSSNQRPRIVLEAYVFSVPNPSRSSKVKRILNLVGPPPKISCFKDRLPPRLDFLFETTFFSVEVFIEIFFFEPQSIISATRA